MNQSACTTPSSEKMTSSEAAAFLQISANTFERKINEGKIPRGIKTRGKRHWLKSTIEALPRRV